MEGFLALKDKQPQLSLCSASGAYGQAISEYLLATLLSIYKLLPQYRDNQHKKVWEDLGRMRSIRDATVLVVGAGSIGGEFAALVKALGARVIGIRRSPAEARPPLLTRCTPWINWMNCRPRRMWCPSPCPAPGKPPTLMDACAALCPYEAGRGDPERGPGQRH